MPSYFPAKKNAQYIFYLSLAPQAGGNALLANPTLELGDAKVSVDGGSLTDIILLPVVTPANSKLVKVTLSANEMNGDNITVIMSDAAGDEWRDVVVFIQTTTMQTMTQVPPSVTGSNLIITRAVTFVATLIGITLPASWDKLYFTAKQSPNYSDSTALIQIALSNPALPGDGLLILNQQTGVAANGRLVVAGDSITIHLADDATVMLSSGDSAPYDIKVVVDGASALLATGKVTIAGTPTASI